MVQSTLQHLIYGRAIIADQPAESPGILAISDEMSPEDASQLIEEIPLTPLPIDQIEASQGVAFVALNNHGRPRYAFARSHFQSDDRSLPVYQLVMIPEDLLLEDAKLDALLELVKKPIPTYSVTHAPLDPLTLPPTPAPDIAQQAQRLQGILGDLLNDDSQRLLGLLACALQGGLVLSGFPDDPEQRLNLIRAMRLIMPQSTHHLLTFTTHTEQTTALPRVAFIASSSDQIKHVDWHQMEVDAALYDHAYISLLATLWDGNAEKLLQHIRRLDEIASVMVAEETLSLETLLSAVTERHHRDVHALQGEPVATADILDSFKSAIPMALNLQTAYMTRLLEDNFESRDAEVAHFIARQLDASSDLDTDIVPFLDTAIDEQPDAVYAFIRSHLAKQPPEEDIDPRWLDRLHRAAKASVAIAIESGAPDMIRSWLVLIGREPLRYQLNDILHAAMLEAQPYAYEDAELATELVRLGVRRQPDLIDTLLVDEALVEVLSGDVREAILENKPAAIEALAGESRELFLLALKRGIKAGERCVTSPCVRALWQIYTQHKSNTLSPPFRALTLIEDVVAQPASLETGAMGTLLTLILAEADHDDIFKQTVPALSTEEQFVSALAQAIDQSNRVTDDMVQIVANLLAIEALSGQNAVSVLSTVLTNRNWGENSMPYVEQLARVMTQHPETTTTIGVLWKLAELSSEHKSEQMLKVSLRRLLGEISDMVAEEQIVESVQRLRKYASWSANGRAVLLNWWRHYARECGTGQLQKLEKQLEGKKTLEDLRAIVQTSVAMRRIIGNRTLQEFSDAVATTYNLLQALSEGFDPNDKVVDSVTIRRELEARAQELPVELRPVLATNLKELAQLVTTLSDNRSKASIIRSDDAVERQLVTGEQEPQSAIDVMRWLSGYLDGIQKDDDAQV